MNHTKKSLEVVLGADVERHYVRNGDLLPAVIEAKELGIVTEKLILMIEKIAENYSRKHNFIRYSYREDMVATAVENLCRNALKFDHIRFSNPFAYYTSAIHNSFLQYMADEKKQRNIRDALLVDAGSNPSFNFLESEKDESDFEIKDSDEIDFKPEKGEDAVEEVHVDLPTREERIGNIGKQPGAVLKYDPADIIFDPATGNITVREGAVPREFIAKANIEKPKKRIPFKKKVVVVEESVEPPPAKKSRSKKDK